MDEHCLELSSSKELVRMERTQLSFTVRSHVDDDMSMSSIHLLDSKIVLGTVIFGSVHHCCRLGLYIPLRPVECVGGIELVRQNDRWIEQMLQELFCDDWDITQVFTWDPGGGEW